MELNINDCFKSRIVSDLNSREMCPRMNRFRKSSLFYYLICFLSISSCSVEQVMSKAGVMTHPRCAKYSTEEAVATCEAGLRVRSEPRFSVGFGFSKRM